MPAPAINVLVFEDNPADVLFLREALEQDALNTFALTVVERLRDGLSLLTANSYEVVLLDLGLPDSRGLATFEQVQHVAPDLPIVIFSGNTDEQAAILAVRAGAQEYVVKGPVGYAMTGRTIRHAIERKRIEREWRQSEDNLARTFEVNPAALVISRLADGTFIRINPTHTRLFGYAPEEIIGRSVREVNIYMDWTERAEIVQILRDQKTIRDREIALRTKSGAIITALMSMELIRFGGEDCILSALLDITDRKQAEEKLRESEVLLRQVLESSPDSTFALDRDYRFLIDNRRHQHELVASGGHPFEVGEPMLSPD